MLEAIYESMGREGLNFVRQRFQQAVRDGIGEDQLDAADGSASHAN